MKSVYNKFTELAEQLVFKSAGRRLKGVAG
jgi:hypothetical protein